MKTTYNVLWTENAISELKLTLSYLKTNFTKKETQKLVIQIEQIVVYLSTNPEMFALSELPNIRKVVILKYNTIYFRIQENEVQILSFFSNRKNPKSRKL